VEAAPMKDWLIILGLTLFGLSAWLWPDSGFVHEAVRIMQWWFGGWALYMIIRTAIQDAGRS